jgi:PAS domain S-box-containing protein
VNLQRKILLVVGLAVILLSTGLYLTLRFAVLAGFDRLERQTLFRNVGRVIKALEDDLEALAITSEDWGSWDETCDFMTGRNPGFPAANLMTSTFRNLRLDFMVFVDPAGDIRLGREYDAESDQTRPLSERVTQALQIPGPLFPLPDTQTVQGLILCAPHPVLVVSHPILTSHNEGPPRGVLILGRALDRRAVQALGDRTYITVDILPIHPLRGIDKAVGERLLRHESPQTLADPGDGRHLYGYHLLRDVNRQPIALARVIFPREIYLMARTSVNLMIWLVVGVSIILGMLALALVRQLILVNLVQSLDSLNTGIFRIAKDGNPARRVKHAGQDEMSELADGINRMLDTLEQAQTRLRESENRYRSLVESAPDAIFTLDPRGYIESMNSTTTRRLQPADAPAAPATLEGLFPGEAAALLQPALDRIWAGGEAIHSIEVRRAESGTDRWFAVSLAPVRHDRQILQVLGIARDITDRVQAEHRAREQQQQLIQAHKLMALGTLVSGVAHEINNPNNVIMLNTPLIRRALDRLIPYAAAQARQHPEQGPAPEAIAPLPEMLRGIEEASRRIQKIVESLKDFARPNPNRLNERVDLKSTLEAALQLLDHPLHRATRRFSWQCPVGLPALTGNKQRLEQVFINLLQNACQALPDPEQAITLTVLPPGPSDRFIRILIRDEGIGIPAEHLPHLATPFFTTKRDRGGTGLGLSISLGILKEHGGDLAFDSQPGRGTTAIVTLPCPPQSAIEMPASTGHNPDQSVTP